MTLPVATAFTERAVRTGRRVHVPVVSLPAVGRSSTEQRSADALLSLALALACLLFDPFAERLGMPVGSAATDVLVPLLPVGFRMQCVATCGVLCLWLLFGARARGTAMVCAGMLFAAAAGAAATTLALGVPVGAGGRWWLLLPVLATFAHLRTAARIRQQLQSGRGGRLGAALLAAGVVAGLALPGFEARHRIGTARSGVVAVLDGGDGEHQPALAAALLQRFGAGLVDRVAREHLQALPPERAAAARDRGCALGLLAMP